MEVLFPLLTLCPDKLKFVQTFLPTFSKRFIFSGSGNIVVGIATRLGAGRQGIESRQGREILFCPQRPDRLCDPPSLLFNGYWVYFLEREFGIFPCIHCHWMSWERLGTGWTIRGSNSGGGEIFRTLPDGPWGPSGLLGSVYRAFSESKAAGAWSWPHTPSSADVKSGAIPLLPLCAFVARCTVNFTLLTFTLSIAIETYGAAWLRDMARDSFTFISAAQLLTAYGLEVSTSCNVFCYPVMTIGPDLCGLLSGSFYCNL